MLDATTRVSYSHTLLIVVIYRGTSLDPQVIVIIVNST